MRRKLYLTYEEASLAAQHLKIEISTEYRKRYREDPHLPARPEQVYSEQWEGFEVFLGKNKRIFYTTLKEASIAAIALGIKTGAEYKERYCEDPKLPADPRSLYKKQWPGFDEFLHKEKSFYSTYEEARLAVQSLVIKTQSEYKKRYHEDPHLPSTPSKIYTQEWQGFKEFLGNISQFYLTYQEASEAARALKIKTYKEYTRRYSEDPRLPATPNKIYAIQWHNFENFLRTEEKFYPTYQDASKAARTMGIKNQKEYRLRYKEEPKLPFAPEKVYKEEWHTFSHFLNTNKKFYENYNGAREAVLTLGIKTAKEYVIRYKEDSRLPFSPKIKYSQDWQGFRKFLGSRGGFYLTYQEASNAAQSLGIKTTKEYTIRYKEDSRLPSCPNKEYKSQWTGYAEFLGKKKKVFYSTYQKASTAAQSLGIKTYNEYLKRYHEDPKLPCSPKSHYPNEWQGFSKFLAKNMIFYQSYIEASNAAQSLDIRTKEEYLKLYKKDPKLPATPNKFYLSQWKGYRIFLGLNYDFYQSYEEASEAAIKLCIISVKDYKQNYIKDLRLHSDPAAYYSKDWSNWCDFLLPKHVNNLVSFKQACQVLGVKNSQQYKKARNVIRKLPSKPEKTIEGWISWYDALDIPKPYQYDILRQIVIKHNCVNMADYKEMRVQLVDPRIPSSPEEYYKGKGWTNTFDFFGKPRPYQIKYFTDEWRLWAEKIEEFLKSARGGDTKAKDLCEFVREYIEPNGFEKSPLEYLTRGKTNIQPMLDLFDKVPITRKKKWLYSINEFLDWVVYNYLLLEDVDTGEITPIKGANNPFSHISFNGERVIQVANETNKLALPYQFVKSGRDWIYPDDSITNKQSYSDLTHLHVFPADWVAIEDISLIDESDPDCVVKVDGDKTYLWFPVYWTYTYALMQLPARGMQIVYCDSGEADSDIADFKNNKVIWKKNKSKLAGLTKHQGMVSKTGKDDFGVHYTSNKTHFDGKGYFVPFMPIELAYWLIKLIKLRKWQQKYNPIEASTHWLDCKRTNLNELQRKQKGINSFLFRDFQEDEPGNFGGRLTQRLAAALFFSAKDEVTTAIFKGQTYADCIASLKLDKTIPLYHFKSLYTPHSMRVSLINAYAYEFGIPLEVIMKLVGHSSIMMQIYYIKSDKTGANIRERIEKGEKEALSNAVKTFKSYVEQQRIEECKSQLVASSPEFLNSLDNSRPASNYLFKDFGICPVGGAFCSEGGKPVATKANIFYPVPAGYLGEQNCIQCRFFITGPAFMVGLAALFNEVSLAVNTQSFRYSKLEAELNQTAQEIEVISHKLYERKTADNRLERDRKDLISQRQKLNSEIETRAKKLDLYMSDMNAVHRHIHNCQQVLDQQLDSNESSKLQLIVPRQFEIDVELDEVSSFHQLSEVCENAELYHSCSDELSVTRRSQALDQMMVRNSMPPRMFLLSEEEQLAVGNQLTQLMLSRLESWESVDRLMDGRLSMMDLSEDTKFTANTIQELFERSQPLKRIK
ncbi:gamma-mobile-trio integrase GmtZ [Photobacterium chitinilyticum]|uniref:Integrase n=1 Tax=Photobacterium chitinilyticum TaxID=2485123 RepID=A0A444JMK1_9GAMM|nr:VPA1269 family protein [Photobacterium chitinilyticum]RWX54336.1 integrase [Photobacterium chitinilyticum]